MTIKQALAYIRLSVQEGYLDIDESEKILKLPKEEIIKWAEEEAERGDAYADAVVKGEA